MKLHILIAAITVFAATTFADVITSYKTTTSNFTYAEDFTGTVTLTNVLVSYDPNESQAGHEFWLHITSHLDATPNISTVTNLNVTGMRVVDINPNIVTDNVEVKLLKKTGPNTWVPVEIWDYKWNIPEPATMSLFLTAGVGLLVIRRIKRY